MTKKIIIGGLLCVSLWTRGQAGHYYDDGDDYYADIDPTAVDDDLKGQLKALTNPHTVITYDDVWLAFPTIDIYLPRYPCDANLSHIPDVYSAYCWETDNLTETGGECGNYKKEGDCYNREHLWPKSWFGGFDYGANAQTDLFELWPTDGYVNGLRGNLPFGNIDKSTMTYNSTNGCMIGNCDNDDFTGPCFEPADQMKGDFARSYFYLATTYWNEWTCCDTDGTNASDIKPWMENIIRQWHAADPVDDLERSRNDVIFSEWQHNRNPFIDHPEWVDQISDF
jgi:endonuclease I